MKAGANLNFDRPQKNPLPALASLPPTLDSQVITFTANSAFGFDYEVDYDSPDRSNIMFAPTWSLLPGGAHGMYGPALEAELQRRLIEEGRGEDLADIFDG